MTADTRQNQIPVVKRKSSELTLETIIYHIFELFLLLLGTHLSGFVTILLNGIVFSSGLTRVNKQIFFYDYGPIALR